MTAQEASQKWAKGAVDALDSAQKLYQSKKNQHALFFCHLAVEKALKARFIKDNDKLPPYTHDLILLSSGTSLILSPDQAAEITKINSFNIDARYQEEKDELMKLATEHFTSEWLKRAELILKSILE